MNFIFLGKYFEYYLRGVEIIIVLVFFVVLFGIILGFGLIFLRCLNFKLVSFIVIVYVEFVRGILFLV